MLVSIVSVACVPGEYRIGEECIECPIGFYQPVAGQSLCLQCPLGMTTEEEGTEYEYECYDYETNQSIIICKCVW